MRISDWSSDVCSSDLSTGSTGAGRSSASMLSAVVVRGAAGSFMCDSRLATPAQCDGGAEQPGVGMGNNLDRHRLQVGSEAALGQEPLAERAAAQERPEARDTAPGDTPRARAGAKREPTRTPNK